MKNIIIVLFSLFAVTVTAQRHHISYDEAAPPANGAVLTWDQPGNHYLWQSAAFSSGVITADSWDKNVATDVDNWIPAGFSANTGVLVIDVIAGGDWKGLQATVSGHQLMVCNLNTSAGNIKVKKAQGSSLPENQFCDHTDLDINPGECNWMFYYDADGAGPLPGCWYTLKP